jgi:hypothetical protein
LTADTPDDDAVLRAEMFAQSSVRSEMLSRLGFDEAWYETAPPTGESPEHDAALERAGAAAAEWLEGVAMDTRLHRDVEPFND